jgi:diacylglycerol kinase family enzyme
LPFRRILSDPRVTIFERPIAANHGTVLVRSARMTEVVPAIVNRAARGATEAIRALTEVGGYEIAAVAASEIPARLREIIAQKPRRVLIAGGDGSLCTAAHVLAESGVEMAILPAGTLNHLARHLGLPADLHDAAALAHGGITRPIDAGRINGRLFLNTSSVGAYESFVRRRERFERHWGYTVGSVIAGWQILFHAPSLRVTLDVHGTEKVYRTPLIFVGVGERELRIPVLGSRAHGGKRGLHVMIVRSRSGARLTSLAIQAAARGVEAMARTPSMDAFVVDRFTIDAPHRSASIDGELISVEPPLQYEFIAAALRVVVAERREANRPAVLEV